MRSHRTSHRFRRLAALTLLSVLALLPLSVQFHAFHHGHGVAAHSDCDHSGHERGSVQASQLTACNICDLFVSRVWLYLESPAHNLLTCDSTLGLSCFESRLAVWSRLYRSRSPPA